MSERLVQIGMRAAIRDVQDWVALNGFETWDGTRLDPSALNAYLLAMLITAGAYEDISDGQG